MKTPPVDYSQILHDLSGHWVGTGFTVIAVPSTTNPLEFDLKTFHTHETLVFSGVREGIRNAAHEYQIFLKSIQYLQQISDMTTHQELHVEAGMWIYQPGIPTNTTPIPELFRAGTVPHGTTFIAGSVTVADEYGPPSFNQSDISIPFPFGDEEDRIDSKYVTIYKVNPPIPATLIPLYTDAFGGDGDSDDDSDVDVNDGKHIVIFPTRFLEKDIENQTIYETKTISLSTNEPGPSFGGICSIPMIIAEVNISQVEVTFYIETVDNGDGTYFYQLQYFQQVLLNFPVFNSGKVITWPHISVATLRKQAGEFV